MATTNVLAPTTAAATAPLGTNPTFGAPVALTLIAAAGTVLDHRATVDIQKQNSTTEWATIATLSSQGQRQLVLQTSGTYRILKGTSETSYGVDLDT